MTKIKFKGYRDKEEENLSEDGLPPTSAHRRRVHPLKPDSGEETRTNYRIVRCCLNCRYHFATGPSASRIGCSHPYIPQNKAKQLNWEKRIGTKEFLLLLIPTHASCCCKAHEFRRSEEKGLEHITKYCGAEYLGEDLV